MQLVRRRFLTLLAGSAAPAWAVAQQRLPQQSALLVGVATSLADCGLAQRLKVAVARDTGLAIQLVPGPSGKVLSLLEQGEVDAAVTHAPELELALERRGLAHDRRFVAANDFVIAGPLPRKGGDPAVLPLRGERDAVRAMAAIAEAGARGAARFVSGAERSGSQLKESQLWGLAKAVPQGPWHLRAGAGMGETLAIANDQQAFVLVDRATWLTSSRRARLGLLVEGDPRLADAYHAMLPFRATHPGAKLFMNWLSGPTGRRVVQRAPGGFRARPVAG
ncbi:LysR substrate-binding domain-containing protein [Aquabacterium sp. A7-Y]|uniref:substrate-binding domain-containing protein n=1 Tax=Aquabacterium sp. A7-Y TaxID=1349605 RepID=UPI00223CF826|nr:substrate-binding domain-containing protein [Aquabacterium sp. A7-Y]MCW7538320.1 LysR substrate-binding domain-containing protein [Aquabacterium sp. A7-Y]